VFVVSLPGVSAPDVWRAGDLVDGRYEVLGELGRGGMGVVHRVRHLAWGVDLAVKSPHHELFQASGARERFAAEAETWVGLGVHPNVCACHYVRVLGGVPRVFAEYLPGGSLGERIEDRRLYEGGPGEVSARLLDVAIQIAWGLEHAHGRGLVHQDVKPANVLLDDDGTAKVTDFGLARAWAMATTPPELHAAAAGVSILVPAGGMTREYASPEQAAGAPLGRRSDVYSFAVSVLEMFTGGLTWMTGPAAGEALAAYRADGGAETGLPAMPPGLAGLLARCLSQDPAGRPGSMAEVAAELAGIYHQVTSDAYPRPAPVPADLRADELNNRALSLLDLGRHDEAGQAFTAALAADPRHLVATYNVGLARWRRGQITDEDLITELEEARAVSGDPGQAAYLMAQVHLERGELDAARHLLAEAERERPGDPEVGALLGVIGSGEVTGARCVDATEIPWLSGSPGTLKVSLSSDGRLAVTGHSDGGVRLWDVPGGSCLRTLGRHKRWVSDVDISADGRFAVSASTPENIVRFWDLTDRRCLQTFGRCLPALTPDNPLSLREQSLRLSADARRVVAPDDDQNVLVWDPRSGELRHRLGGHDGYVRAEVSADGRWALSSTSNRGEHVLRLWDLDTGRIWLEIPGNPAVVSAMCLSADGRTAAVASQDRAIRRWDLATGRCTGTATFPAGDVATLSLSADGRLALSGGDDNAVRLWDLDSGRCLRTFREHRDKVRRVQLGSDARSGLSAGQDDAVRWWAWQLPRPHASPAQLSRPRRPAELSRLGGTVDALVSEAEQAMSTGGYASALEALTRARAVPGYERAPRVLSAWRALGQAAVRVGIRAGWTTMVFTGEASRSVDSVGLSADGRIAVSGCFPGAVRLWDTGTGRCLRAITTNSMVDSVQLSADGRLVMSASDYGMIGGTWSSDGTIGVWSADTGERLCFLDREQTGGAKSACLNADGRLALAGCRDNTVRLWDLDNGSCLRTLTGHRDRPHAVWLSPDGRHSVSADSHSLRLWDTGSGRCLRVIAHGHPSGVSVCLSGDGRLVLSTGYHDQPMRLWDAATGDLVRAFGEHGNANRARFSPDGRFAVSGGWDGAIRVWDVGSGRCLRVFDGHQGTVSDIALTPDGRYVLSGSSDGTMRLWELDWELAVGGPADQDGSRAP
jgi:WD40 repeat protein/serine/threonine protein kinase